MVVRAMRCFVRPVYRPELRPCEAVRLGHALRYVHLHRGRVRPAVGGDHWVDLPAARLGRPGDPDDAVARVVHGARAVCGCRHKHAWEAHPRVLGRRRILSNETSFGSGRDTRVRHVLAGVRRRRLTVRDGPPGVRHAATSFRRAARNLRHAPARVRRAAPSLGCGRPGVRRAALSGRPPRLAVRCARPSFRRGRSRHADTRATRRRMRSPNERLRPSHERARPTDDRTSSSPRACPPTVVRAPPVPDGARPPMTRARFGGACTQASRSAHHTRTRAGGARKSGSAGCTSKAAYHGSMLRTVSTR